MSSIYDLFNNRKKEIEAIEEAAQAEAVEEAKCGKKKACEGAVEEAGCKKRKACEEAEPEAEGAPVEEAGCKKKKACEGAVEEAGCKKRKACEEAEPEAEEAPVEEAKCGKKKACEGVEFIDEELEESAEVEGYENLDVAIEALETIVTENTNELIEFQAAAYLEDLVLENMMYDDFDEERIEGLMEAVNNERVKKIAAQVQAQWNKLKEWFASVIKAVENFFNSGEQLLKKYKTIIPDAMRNCKAKVRMNNWNDPDTAHQKCLAKIMGLTKVAFSDREFEANKKAMFEELGVKDRAGVAAMVKGQYVNGEMTEQMVSSISLERAKKYINDKKQMIDALKKVHGELNKLFTDLVNRCRQGDAMNSIMPSQTEKDQKSLNFVVGLVTAIINAEIACIKKAANDYVAVIRKAVSSYKPVKANGREKEDPKGLGESYIARLESVTELEFIDEVDEIDFED